MTIQYKTFTPTETLPPGIILPQQTHGSRIVEIITGQEDLNQCDGVWTRHPQFLLGAKTADCAPICFWDSEKYGVLHAGWRGVVNGAVENMLEIFSDTENTKLLVGPLLPQFEIQRDECYQLIHEKFGDRFFTKPPSNSPQQGESLQFEFKKCLQHLLPQAIFDPRSTFEDNRLASWRRDKSFPKGQNTTIIGPSALILAPDRSRGQATARISCKTSIGHSCLRRNEGVFPND